MRGAVLATAAAVAATLLVAFAGASRIAPEDGYDGEAHVAYARVLADEGRLPTEDESYEFTTPPAYAWLAAQLERATGTWRAGQALAALFAAGLVALAALIARELWPGRPWRWAAAAALTAALPVVPRLGAMFHPETMFAFLAALAVWLALRAERRSWPLPLGAATGAALGLAALTRPTAAAVIAALGAAVLLAGRRRALPFAAVAAAAILLVAGPWWARQLDRYGNPLESNLDRYILADGQPREFWVPTAGGLRDVVVHPYRPAFAGQLLPQAHADLWSDWFGGQHRYWAEEPGPPTRAVLSAQSVLGLLATPVLLAGLVLLARGRGFAGLALALLVAVSWVAFVVQLVRFPQAGGDPIKASYMLYLAPAFAVAGVAAWERLGRARPLAVAWAALYALSYAAFLATSWPAR